MLFGEENYDLNFNRNTEDKIFKNNEIIKTDELDQNNSKENYSEIKIQNNIKNEDLNLSNISSEFITMNSKNISVEEKLANCILNKSEVILNTKKEGEKLVFIFESVFFGKHHIFISYRKLLEIKEYLKKINNILAKNFIKYMEFLE